MARQRRGRTEGGIYQRGDGLWVGCLSLGYDGNGKRRRRVVYGATKTEAASKLRVLQNRVGQVDPGTLSVGAWLSRWLETVKGRLQPKTHLRYEQLVRLRINLYLGGVKLSRLAPILVQQFFDSMEREGVSARGRQMAGMVLSKALRDAVRLQLIPHNPASEIAKPRPDKKTMQVYDGEQVRWFLNAAKADRLYALYVLALDAGMRQGELFAVQWSDFDFDASVVVIQRSLEEINGKLRVKQTKSDRGRRRIDLSRFTVGVLQERRKEALALGHYRPDAPVFCDGDGGHLRKSNVLRRSFWPCINRANEKLADEAAKTGKTPMVLPQIRFHDLRHTCATLLLMADENVKVVSERLGHASTKLTLDTYSHVLPTMQKRAAEKMDGILGTKAVS